MGWEPYTLDELRQLDGEPIWAYNYQEETGEWGILRIVHLSKNWFIVVSGAQRGFGDKDTYGETWLAYPAPPEQTLEQHQRATVARLRPCRECVYFSDNLSQHETKPDNKVHWCDRYEIVLDGGCTCGTFRRYRKENGE